MKVSLNLKPCDVPDALTTVGEVIDHVENHKLAEGHGLNRIILDGEILELEDEQAVAGKPVAEVELLEFYSARPVDLAIEGLTYATELLPSMSEDLAAISQDLRSANLEEGLLRFHECLGYIGWYVTLVNASHKIIATHDPNLQYQDLADTSPESDLSQVQPPADGPELKTFASLENLRQKLNDMEGVQQNKDNLLLADLIEYEILPIVRLWSEEVATILKQVQAEAGMA